MAKAGGRGIPRTHRSCSQIRVRRSKGYLSDLLYSFRVPISDYVFHWTERMLNMSSPMLTLIAQIVRSQDEGIALPGCERPKSLLDIRQPKMTLPSGHNQDDKPSNQRTGTLNEKAN